ncbi:hypothetical protein ACTSEZ_01995 [Metabacillus sp. JX24]|uniref:hypothetical protein n=1 Tax=Metabacillus sp. JX24 TaxID=3240759 RepID=UPI003510186F
MKNFIFPCFFLLFFTAGCTAAPQEKKTQEEILSVINEDIADISANEVKANQILGSVSGANYRNDQELYDVLVQQVIPTFNQAVDDAEALDPKSDELDQQLKEMTDALKIYQKALLLEKEALEKQDEQLMKKSNQLGLDYQTAIKKYHEGMEKLTEKYGISYEPTRMNAK